MTKELCYVIDQISREKGISRDILIETLRSALLSATRKKFGGRTNVDLRIDPKTCDISAFETMKIVSKVTNKDEEISIDGEKKIFPEMVEGDTVNVPLDLHGFSRIAAQTAKQVIFQRVREAERDVIYSEFKDKVGQIVSGIVMRKEKGIYFINLGKTEAILPIKDTLPNENLKRSDTVRAFIEDVRITPKGPAIMGTRVQSIVRELRGERIDIIPWSDDPRQLIARALSPAAVDRIGINEESKTAMVVVNDQQLSLAIGKKGQNVRLAMKLTGWDIDILSETEYSKIRVEEADRAFEDTIKKDPGKKDIPSVDG